MNDAQIKHMVDRFLQWKVPADFSPDGGVKFDPHRDLGGGFHRPVGTNILTATQAEAMIRHLLEDLPEGAYDAGDLKELERMVPPELLNDVLTHNPLHRVYFRAGLLACREYMARFVEQGGNATVAASIRANWWPSLGPDPGAPRRLAFDELVDEVVGADGKPAWPTKDIDPSVEALPVASAFLAS